MTSPDARDAWPALSYAELRTTSETLLLWTQIAGKVAVARSPWINHSWHATLHPSARGLSTGLLPAGTVAVQLEFDFIDHQLKVRTSEGAQADVALERKSVAQFYAQTMQALAAVGAATRIVARPNELPEAQPFADDTGPRDYDPAVARDLWRALVQIHRVFTRFRSRFLGKVSPVHYFWGAADLAVTRFSGRRAPLHPGGVPNLPDAVTREAYSHEVSSAGFWPGDARAPEPSFYAYAYPAPSGFAEAKVSPPGAWFDRTLGEFLLPYQEVRRGADPDAVLLSFLQTTYEAAADLGGWDRQALECVEGPVGRPRTVA